MALVQTLTLKTPKVTQSSDLTTLIITDTTGEYNVSTNPGGWGTPNGTIENYNSLPDFSSIYIVYTSPEGVETVYTDIYTCGPVAYRPSLGVVATTTDDFVFNVNNSHLWKYYTGQLNTTPIGSATDPIADGLYTITLTLYPASTPITTSVLITGGLMTAVYTKLKDIPYSHTFKFFSNDYKEWDSILIPIYCYSLYQACLAQNTGARVTENLDIIKTLERLTA